MKKKFKAKDFDEVSFVNSGVETEDIFQAKEYLKDIQMTLNIGDLNDSLFCFEDLKSITKEEITRVFESYLDSIFSTNSLSFLEKTKLVTSFTGFDIDKLAKTDYECEDNFIYLNSNLVNHCSEFITAIWDSIILIKIADFKKEESILVPAFNALFAKLTKIKTGNENAYIKKNNNLDMITELALFLQYYMPDFFIYLIKSKEDISTKQKVKKVNKEFVEILKKSTKIAHRLSMLQQIKSNNYQYLLQLLITQKNSELK